MPSELNGLVTWITGGGSGIGHALALELASRGAKIAVSGRRQERLDEVAAEVERHGSQALAVSCDVTDEKQVAEAVVRVVEHFGQLDVAVANAGFGVSAPFEKITPDQWKRQMEVNVVGVATTLFFALPELRKTGGRAVVVSSVAGKIASPGSSAYSASKYALVGLCDALWQELHGSGVSLTNILPGFVASEIAQVDNEGVFHSDREDRRPQKLMWPTDKAARVMASAIEKRKREFIFTTHGKIGAFLGQHLPGPTYWLAVQLSARSKKD